MGFDSRQAMEDGIVVGQVDRVWRLDGDVLVEPVVFLQEAQQAVDLSFADAEVLEGVRISLGGQIFPYDENVKMFGKAREGGAQIGDVLRKCDDVAACFVLSALADPHQEARGCKATKHFFHLSEVM